MKIMPSILRSVLIAVILSPVANAVEPPAVEWERTFGGPAEDEARSALKTADCGFILAGSTASYGAGGRDVYLIKTDANGNVEWERTFGGAADDWAYSLGKTSDGGLFLAGTTESFGAGQRDVYLIKTDANGEKQWEKTYGGANNDDCRCALQTTDGGYVLAGCSNSFGRYSVAYLVKTDALGNMLWQKTFVEESEDELLLESFEAVCETADGGYALTSYQQGGLYPGPCPRLLKTDGEGTMEWKRWILWPEGAIGFAFSLRQTVNGAYIAAGQLSYFTWPPPTTYIPYQAYLFRTDLTGNVEWQRVFGGPGREIAQSLQPTLDGGYIMAGYTNSDSLSAGDDDVYLVKTDSDGNMEWETAFGGTSADQGFCIQQCADGGYIVVGVTESFAEGDSNVYLLKLAPETTTPLIAVSPTSFSITVQEGATTLVQMLDVWNSGRGILQYTVEATPPDRIDVSPISGRSTGSANTHLLTLNPADLTPSVYQGTIVVSGNAPNSPVRVFGTLTVLETPQESVSLTVSSVDAGPVAPVELRPGDPLVLGAFLENTEAGAAGPFWLEFWGSRTGGLTLDLFLGDSIWFPGLAGGGTLSVAESRRLYSIPDGPYTVVFAVDRPGEVAETNERDNRAVVGSKRILVFRPPSDADLVVENFTLGPNPVHNGEALQLGGHVRNIGTEDTGGFWIEFWGSYDRAYPDLHFFLCDSIPVANLAPGAAVDLSQYERTLYDCPAGVFAAGTYADRFVSVNERDETNNYHFIDGISFNQPLPAVEARAVGPDLVVARADFAPWSPVKLAAGSPLVISARIENRGVEASGPFWVEFWGAEHGGLHLREFLVDSEYIVDLPAGEAVDIAFERPLYSIPDGPYTVDVLVDRPNDVAETDEGNNLVAVPGKRLLVVRPQTQANLVIENFAVAPNPLKAGMPIRTSGTVRNTGTEPSGPFWIEFWASHDQDYPNLGFFLCDSIAAPSLGPGEAIDLSAYTRVLYSSVPPGPCPLVCFTDRTDLVNELNEADNYAILRDFSIRPPPETWQKTFGGTRDDWAYSVQQTTDGGFILAGHTFSFGGCDMYLVKTDASGNMEWQNTFGGTGSESAHSVQQTTDGGFILAGKTSSFGRGREDMYLVKTDASGNMEWQNTFGGTGRDEAGSVQQTTDGGFVLAGDTESFGAGFFDTYLVKTDASGNTEWQNTFGGTDRDEAGSVQQTTDGGFILAGYSWSFGAGESDMYLVKTDASGNREWQNTVGGTRYDEAYSVQQTTDGGFILAGYSFSFGAGGGDMYLVKTDVSGNMEWQNTFGGTGWDEARSVQQTTDGGFILAGLTSPFGAGPGHMYLVKTDASGNMEWQNTFGGTRSENAHSVQQTTDDGFILAGGTCSFGAGWDDMYLVKTDALGNSPNPP